MKILIVEDEKALRTPMRKFLEKRNFSVEEASNGAQALSMVELNEYDCILLDLNLPEIDGINVAKHIKENITDTPIIMVTARSQIYNKLEGFEAGADDYLTKPFDLNELVARINAVIRRKSQNTNKVLEFDGNILNPHNNTVNAVNDISIELSTKETSVLEYMLRNKGRIVSSEELLEHVWGRDVDMFSETVKTHIKTLRQKVDNDKKYIKTVRGKGYIIN